MPAQKIASEVHKRNGTYKKHPERENKEEPKVPRGVPKPGKKLTGNKVARAKHKELSKIVLEIGIESTIDADVMDRYCLAWAKMCDAHDRIEEQGLILSKIQGGIGGCEVFYSNPANREYWSANSELNRLQAHFGMGAGNRSKLQAHVQEESDPFLEFMERQKNLTN